MTEDDKKKLTEWMGECWHTAVLPSCIGDQKCSKCGYRWNELTKFSRRTFTTDADMLALFRQLAGKELWLWSRFLDFVGKYHNRSFETGLTYQEFFAALFYDPERFCNLVAKFKPWEK